MCTIVFDEVKSLLALWSGSVMKSGGVHVAAVSPSPPRVSSVQPHQNSLTSKDAVSDPVCSFQDTRLLLLHCDTCAPTRAHPFYLRRGLFN